MTAPIRQPLSFYNGAGIQYVAPYGNDANDGLDFRYPKKHVLAAYDALAVGGYIYIMDGSYVGGEIEGQGLWFSNGWNQLPPQPEYPGWRHVKPVQFQGVGQVLAQSTGLFSYPMARIFPGREGDTEKPDAPFDVLYWLTANGGVPQTLSNILLKDTSIGIRLAVNGNPEADPFSAGQRGGDSDETTSQFIATMCSVQNDGHGSDVGEGPAVDIGYILFTYFYQMSTSMAANGSPKDSDRHSAYLIKPGAGTSAFILHDSRSGQCGVKYYANGNPWSVYITDFLVESDGSDIPPAVHLIGVGQNGAAVLDEITTADTGSGSDPAIWIEPAANTPFLPTQVKILGTTGISTRGPCDVAAASSEAAFDIRDFQALAIRMGHAQGKIWGDHDIARMAGPVVTAQFRNLLPQHEDDGGETGPVLQEPGAPSGNCTYTATGAGGGHGVDSPIADKFGGTTGFQVASTDTSQANMAPFAARPAGGVVVGDAFVAGFWVRGLGDGLGHVGLPQIGTIWTLELDSANSQPTPTTTKINLGEAGECVVKQSFIGDGEWQWRAGAIQVSNLNGGNGACSLKISCRSGEGPEEGVAGMPFQFCGGVLIRVNAAVATANDLGNIVASLSSYAQCKAGMATAGVGQVLHAAGGFAPGNLVAAAAVGAAVKLMPIKDPITGSIVGYLEVKPLA